MNHTELVDRLAGLTQTTKADAARMVDAVVQTMMDALKSGEEARVNGLGIFDVSVREARPGRNPQTGQTINIPASKALRFRAGKAAKDQLNAPGEGKSKKVPA